MAEYNLYYTSIYKLKSISNMATTRFDNVLGYEGNK